MESGCINKCKPQTSIYHKVAQHEIEHNQNVMPIKDSMDWGAKSSFAWLQELFIVLSGVSLTSSMPAERAH